MNALVRLAGAALAMLATPATAQHGGHAPAAPADGAATKEAPGMKAPPAPAAEHAGVGHGAVTRGAADGGATTQPAGDAPAPPPVEPSYADRVWGSEAMAPARAELRREHGGLTYGQVLVNLLEHQVRGGGDGLRWDGEGFYGDDLNRVVVRSEGSTDKGRVEDAEVQLLYSRTIGPYTFLQAGVRRDFKPSPMRTYASVGFETLVPYGFDVEGTLFVSNRGDLLARAEAYYDLRITQRLIVQPRLELNLAAQDVRATRIGAGVSDVELGLRMRYELRREIAPYIGVSFDRDLGDTARFTRARGQDVGGFSFAAGLRTWF